MNPNGVREETTAFGKAKDVLAVAIQTERPELLQVFAAEARSTLDEAYRRRPSDGLAARDLGRAMVSVIETLFAEVYDLRRACRTMQDSNKQVEQLLQGTRKHLAVINEVAHRGLDGDMPAAHNAADIREAVWETIQEREED